MANGFGDVSTNPELAGNNLAMNAVPAIAAGNTASVSGKGIESTATAPATAGSSISPAVAQLAGMSPANTGMSQANTGTVQAATIAAKDAQAASQAIESGLNGMPGDPQTWFNSLSPHSQDNLTKWANQSGQSPADFINNVYNAHVVAAFNPEFAKVTEAAGIAPSTSQIGATPSFAEARAKADAMRASVTEPTVPIKVAYDDKGQPKGWVQGDQLVGAPPASVYSQKYANHQIAVANSPKDIASYQKLLAETVSPISNRPYYQGKIDGKANSGDTIAAIVNFQNENGLIPDGLIGVSPLGETGPAIQEAHRLSQKAVTSQPATTIGGQPASAQATSPAASEETFKPGPNAQKAINAEAGKIMQGAVKSTDTISSGYPGITGEPPPSAKNIEKSAIDPYQSWLTGQDTASLANGAAAAGMNVSDYAKSVYYGHVEVPPIQQTPPAKPAETVDPLTARMRAIEAAGVAGNPVARPPPMETTKDQSRLLKEPSPNVTPAPPEVPLGPRPRHTSSNDLAGMTQVAGNLPPAASETLPSDLQPLTVPGVSSETWRAINQAGPEGKTPMGPSIPAPTPPAIPSTPIPTKGPTIKVNDAFNNYYQSIPAGAQYVDPQGNVRVKRGGMQMAA